MENHLPMIVKFVVKEGKVDFVKSELIKILEPTRQEDGCIKYVLHQDIDNQNIFIFYEIWDTKASWKAHDKKAHIVNLKEAIEGSVEKISFNKLKII